MYVCMYVHVCMHVPRNRGSFVRSRSIQKENLKKTRGKLKPREISCFVFGSEEYELKQVKVKNSRELKRYVSQNISAIPGTLR